MAYARAEFRVDYPEFEQTSNDTIDAALARSAAVVSETVWGDRFELALGLRTASYLAASPFGFRARPQSKMPSPYQEQWDALVATLPRRGLVLHG
jgi:hypothetical protein